MADFYRPTPAKSQIRTSASQAGMGSKRFFFEKKLPAWGSKKLSFTVGDGPVSA
jgi:hypothetical protein